MSMIALMRLSPTPEGKSVYYLLLLFQWIAVTRRQISPSRLKIFYETTFLVDRKQAASIHQHVGQVLRAAQTMQCTTIMQFIITDQSL